MSDGLTNHITTSRFRLNYTSYKIILHLQNTAVNVVAVYYREIFADMSPHYSAISSTHGVSHVDSFDCNSLSVTDVGLARVALSSTQSVTVNSTNSPLTI